MDLKELEYENMEWIYVDKGRDQRPAVDTFLYELGDPLSSCKGLCSIDLIMCSCSTGA